MKTIRSEIEKAVYEMFDFGYLESLVSKRQRPITVFSDKILALFHKVGEKEYKRGRQSVLDEWKEEKDKLLKGFSYKKQLLK